MALHLLCILLPVAPLHRESNSFWIYGCKGFTEELLLKVFWTDWEEISEDLEVFFKGVVCSALKFISIFPYSHMFGQTKPCARFLRCFCYKCWDNLSTAALAQVMSELAQ